MSNYSQEELDKFSALAARWWDKTGEFKPLHDINPLRLEFIESLTSLSDKKVLDVGCGGGILSESMAQSGAKVTGIDLGQPSLEVAKLHLYESQLAVTYQLASAEDFAEQHAETFDVVTCMEMLEHVPNPSSVVDACAKLAKPDGYIVFSTLNRSIKSFLMAIVGAEHILQILPKGTHEYSKFIRPAELMSFARRAQLQVEKSAGIHYAPLTQKYRLNHKMDVNYLLAFRKCP